MIAEIVVLNYNGRELLAECIPSLIAAAAAARHACTLVVLDNQSSDGSVKFLKQNFPAVKIYQAHQNRVFCSFNDFARDSNADILILLNSDIKVEPIFVDPLMEVFRQHPDAFMAGPQCWTFDGSQYEGTRTRIGITFGFFQGYARYPGYQEEIRKPGYTASAGSVMAFRRDRFLELGGYDDLYLPGRVEDVDLCYRGWKRGYKAYYTPESIAYHKGMASFERDFGYRKTLTMAYRNTFLFMWKNITDGYIMFEHILFLIPWMLLTLAKGNPSFTMGFLEALSRFSYACARRRQEAPYFKKTDRELLGLLGWNA